MKKIHNAIFIFVYCIFLFSCKSNENCLVCENKNLNEVSKVEICEEGQDLFVTTEIIKIKNDTIIKNATAIEYSKIWENRGYTCQ